MLFLRNKLLVSVLVFLLSFYLGSTKIFACIQTSECSGVCSGYPACSYSCQGVYTAGGVYQPGHCVSTQDTNPGSVTPVGYQCNGNWSNWTACSGGSQTRTCPPDELQIQSCSSSSPGGSSAPTAGPTSPPGCVPTPPATVNLNVPVDGATLTNPSVDLTWFGASSWGTGCPDDKKYNVYLSAGVNPPTDLIATTSEGVTTTLFTASPGVTYYWRVATVNGTQGVFSSVRSFTLQPTLTGYVFIDPDNTCSTSTLSSFSGMTATVRGTAYSSAVSTVNGSYSIPIPSGSYNNLDLSGIPAGYYCSTGCFQSCPTISTVSTSTTNNFFLSTLVSGWWQTEGASIYAGSSAGGLVARSQLPSASSKLILPTTGGTPGALIIGSGGYGTGQGTVSNSLWATVSKYKGKKMDYAYFAAKMGVLKGQVSDWTGSDQFSLTGYPTGKDFGYMKPSTSTASITTPITVGVGEKYTIFVNGNLRIENNITVSPGGFLTLIVNGNLTVAPAVTNIQGIFISSGNFVTESAYVSGTTNDVQLEVQGNVISWGSLALARNLGPGNTTTPAEKFVYRTDFISNMPDKMETFAMEWQEVAPGTIGN